MKHLQRIFLSFLFVCWSFFSIAQDKKAGVDSLMKQGEELQNAGKHTEAMEKFGEILKADPDNSYANYGLGYSLYASKKMTDAIPYLEKAVKTTNNNIRDAAYNLLGSIYDENHQALKAINAYNEVIKTNPNYPQIFYNIGIAFFRNQEYADAETAGIEAIRHNPFNASNQRMYGLVAFHQNKRVNALLAFCSFLLLEPNTARSAEAFTNIRSILSVGTLKTNPGNDQSLTQDELNERQTLNAGIGVVVAAGKVKKLTGMDLLEYELKGIFTLAGQLSNKKKDKTFFDRFFSDYFYKLAKSDNMPVFTRLVSLPANKEENTQWKQEHMQQVADLTKWMADTERSF
jgi:tetratricopeptide (TPR) repeat protein